MLVNGTWRHHRTLTSNTAHTGHTTALDTGHVSLGMHGDLDHNICVHITSEGLGDMFEVDIADMCAENFPLVSMGGQVCTHGNEDPMSIFTSGIL